VLSKQNRKDIEEIRQDYIRDLEFHYVDRISDVLSLALLPEKVHKAVDLIGMIEPSTGSQATPN